MAPTDHGGPMRVRDATAGGADAVFALLRRFATSYAPEPPAFDRHRPRLVAAGDVDLIVAEAGGEVVGERGGRTL